MKNRPKIQGKLRSVSRAILLLSLLVLFTAGASAADRTVCASGCDNTSIQAAVIAADPGDTIIVHDGTYIENVVVDKRLTIRSQNGSAVTTVQANNSADHVFNVTADYVNISGFTVKDAWGYAAGYKAGIFLSNVTHCNISGNNVTNNGNGIYLWISNNTILEDNTASNSTYEGGILLEYSSNNTIAGNTANSNSGGILVRLSSNNNTLTNNTASNNDWVGILLANSNDTTLLSNTANSNYYSGIRLYQACNNTLTGNNALHNHNDGIELYDSNNNNTISNNTANSNNWDGIYLWHSNNNILENNTFNSNSNRGIFLLNSSSNNLTGNTANLNNSYGIYLQSSSNNTLTGNTAANNHGDGISLTHSSNNTIAGNTASNNSESGIYLSYSRYNNLTGNTANSNNDCGINLEDSSNSNTLTNNTANSNTYYGIFLGFSSNNNTLTSNILSNNDNGIWLAISNNNTLTDNIANSNNERGIRLYQSSNNNLMGNTANLNTYYGILLFDSCNNNTIAGNTASNNDLGIRLYVSSNNTLTGNTVSNNKYAGISLESSYLGSSNDNLIYNNYFNNTNNAYDYSNNTWNITKTKGKNIIGGPYLGGNYWSNYTGDDWDHDCLGDTPYDILGGTNKDYLPLLLLYTYTDVGVIIDIELPDPSEIEDLVPPETNLSNAIVMSVNVTDETPENTTDDAYTDIRINVGDLDVNTCRVYKEASGFLPEVDNVTTLPTVKPPGNASFSRDVANKSVIVRLYVGDPLLGVVPPVPPIASFTYSPPSPVVNEPVTFDASASYDPDGGNITFYWWNVSGTVYTVSQFNHTFTTPGSKYVGLEVWDDENETSSTSKWINVNVTPESVPPIASFTYSPPSPVMNEPVTFDASASYDPDGGNITFYWWNVSGTVYTVSQFNHTFTTPGSKYVGLEVWDDENETSSTSKWINVTPRYPEHIDVGVTSHIELSEPSEIEHFLPNGTNIGNSVVISVNVTDSTPENSTDDAYTDITINVGTLDVDTCRVFKTGSGFLPEVDDVTTLPTVKPPGNASFSRDVDNNSVIIRLYVGDPLLGVLPPASIIHANVLIEPETLNLNSKGKWITCYLELPEGYDVKDINLSTVKLCYIGFEVGGEYGEFNPNELMVKFDRSDIVEDLIGYPGCEVELTVTGELTDGTPFKGNDTIRVIDQGGKK
jgi:parallel beta-helix repeat protein